MANWRAVSQVGAASRGGIMADNSIGSKGPPVAEPPSESESIHVQMFTQLFKQTGDACKAAGIMRLVAGRLEKQAKEAGDEKREAVFGSFVELYRDAEKEFCKNEKNDGGGDKKKDDGGGGKNDDGNADRTGV
jgi:hypothetical protein